MKPFDPYPYRGLFPVCRESIYLNHAAVSPYSRPVSENIRSYTEAFEKGDRDEWLHMQEQIRAAKAGLAAMTGQTPADIGLVPNTSWGLILAASGIDWKAGDEILIPRREFPANVYPFLKMREKGVRITFMEEEDGRITTDTLERAITPSTKLFTLSWVQFLNGYRADLREIGALCRDRDIYFVVDATQGLGAFDLDMASCGIDLLACGAQKWLMGMQGLGFFSLSERFEQILNPPVQGWLAAEKPFDFFNIDQPVRQGPERFSTGTLSTVAVFALAASTRLLNQVLALGSSRHILDLGDLLIEALSALGFIMNSPRGQGEGSGIISVQMDNAHRTEAIFSFLQDRNVHCSYRSGTLRFAIHFYNTAEEIMKVAELCEEGIRTYL